jgi:NADH-quinone oxidoreductase subunit G
MNYGLYDTKVEMDDKVHKGKAQVIGPHVILDQERCVLCSRCVRFCQEVTGTGEMGIFNRGNRARISTAPGVELDNNYSMNTVDICPVGALTSRDFRFQKRVWMLKAADSVCPGCATGCNVRIDYEAGRIYRLKPRYNPEVNGPWMCDKGRLTYKAVHEENRLGDPLVDGRTETWAGVARTLSTMVGAGGFGLLIGSAHQSLEEMHLLKTMAADAPVSGGLAGSDRAEGDNILLDADRTPNRRGLALLGMAESESPALVSLIRGAAGPVLIHGGNPAADPAVAAALGENDSVVYIGTHDNETAGCAAVILPGSMWAEKTGIFVNRDGRLQEFKQAVARNCNARDDWRILSELMTVRGRPDVPGSLMAVRTEMNGTVATYTDLNNLPERGYVPGGEAR